MRKNRISKTMGKIDQKYVDEATAYTGEAKVVRRNGWMKWGAIAACFAVVLLVGTFVFPMLQQDSPDPVSIGGLNRPYKDISVNETEGDIEWPWEYKTIYEKYGAMVFEEEEFTTRTKVVDISLLGDVLGNCEAKGYDSNAKKEYTQTFEVRKIKGISEEKLVAVGLGSEFYVYMHNKYEPQSTLGEFLDCYDLTQSLEFRRFTTYEGYTEKGYYNLKNDDKIWQFLSECRDAEFIEDDSWNCTGRNYISFTATSEALGAYKKVVYVTEDGYVWTNIFNWAYIYYIGEDAAGQIISYATENAEEGQYEPYNYSLAGTVVEIGDDYILVDDSVLCEDPDDGMIFKVPTDNLLIRRYIECYNIKSGDVVVIQFTGDIDVDAGNVINGALSMSEATVADGDIWIAE